MTLFGSPTPKQMAQLPAGPAVETNHGTTHVRGVTRRVYFDLGGEYDLMDDREYDLLKEAVASTVTPTEMGFGNRGVPIDVACSNASNGSSIVRVKNWLRMTIHVISDSGRKFTLTQRLIGFVRRQSPLLIRGKTTCVICGYKTIRQQDRE